MNFSMTYNTHLIAHLRAHLPLEQNKLQQLKGLMDALRRRWTNLERGMAEPESANMLFDVVRNRREIPTSVQ